MTEHDFYKAPLRIYESFFLSGNTAIITITKSKSTMLTLNNLATDKPMALLVFELGGKPREISLLQAKN